MLNLNRNVSDLEQFGQEEFDAFLNLSPLHNIGGSETALNQISNPGSNAIPAESTSPAELANTTNPNNSQDVVQLMEPSTYKSNPNNPAPTTSEDSIFSYIQMAAESSQAINFNMTLNDGIPEAANTEDTKLISRNPNANSDPSATTINHQDQQHLPLPSNNTQSTSQPTTPQRQVPQRSPLFASCQSPSSANSVPMPSAVATPSQSAIVSNNISTNSSDESNTLSSVLNRMLPYQMGPEPLQNLFDANDVAPHAGESNQ